MKVKSSIDKKTASKWRLTLEMSAEEMAMANLSDRDAKTISELMASKSVSDVLLGAYLYAARVEQALVGTAEVQQ